MDMTDEVYFCLALLPASPSEPSGSVSDIWRAGGCSRARECLLLAGDRGKHRVVKQPRPRGR